MSIRVASPIVIGVLAASSHGGGSVDIAAITGDGQIGPEVRVLVLGQPFAGNASSQELTAVVGIAPAINYEMSGT